jgi:hypothetical protein
MKVKPQQNLVISKYLTILHNLSVLSSTYLKFPLTKKTYYFSMPIDIVILAT